MNKAIKATLKYKNGHCTPDTQNIFRVLGNYNIVVLKHKHKDIGYCKVTIAIDTYEHLCQLIAILNKELVTWNGVSLEKWKVINV